MNDKNLSRKHDNARTDCDKIFSKTTILRPLHITLAYTFPSTDDLTSDERNVFNQELIHLEQILPKRITMNPPMVSFCSSMAEFTPVMGDPDLR